MRRIALALCLAFLMTAAGLARPPQGELLSRLLAIADADQLLAYQQLHLSAEQQERLRQAAYDFLPRVRQMKGMPGGQLLLVPEALTAVDHILTPEQRPLVRKLVPRSHQWPKLKALFQDYD